MATHTFYQTSVKVGKHTAQMEGYKMVRLETLKDSKDGKQKERGVTMYVGVFLCIETSL
jgi:hypothetical protein